MFFFLLGYFSHKKLLPQEKFKVQEHKRNISKAGLQRASGPGCFTDTRICQSH